MSPQKQKDVLTQEAIKEAEIIAGVPTRILFADGYWTGFKKASQAELLDLMNSHMEYRPRSLCELDQSFKQIIPYFLVKNTEGKYLFSKRKNSGGDSRAHNFALIGFGGHLRKTDVEGREMNEWLKREFEEEISAERINGVDFAGIVNYDGDELDGINKYHFGLIFVVSIDGQADVLETDKFEKGQMLTVEELQRKNDASLETWSKIILDEYLSRN